MLSCRNGNTICIASPRMNTRFWSTIFLGSNKKKNAIVRWKRETLRINVNADTSAIMTVEELLASCLLDCTPGVFSKMVLSCESLSSEATRSLKLHFRVRASGPIKMVGRIGCQQQDVLDSDESRLARVSLHQLCLF